MMRVPKGLRRSVAVAGTIVLAAHAAAAQGQQPAAKPAPKKPTTGQTVEIRGQAPTPQVVTVRPREVPTYTPSGLPKAVMTAGAWPSVTAAFSVTPASQLAGRLPLDTSAAGLARGGAMIGGVALAGATMRGGAAADAGAAGGITVVGASTQEIEAMRKELAMRNARLDSLQKALHENAARQTSLGPLPPTTHGAARMSAADSAARVAEIESIRQELHYRKARIDSLQREMNSLGRPKQAPAKSDTTQSKRSGTPPRGLR